MPAMNMRELRDTRKLKALLRAGKSVELRDRNRVIGRIVPEADPGEAKEWPDFEARLKEVFGDRVLTSVDDFLEDRHRW
jgi:antitoxin (DNA-binding transcriptional repressor) of toxin-antitoxin stability system